MTSEYIDLHVHSNCSDGTFSPAKLVEYAVQKRLRAFALTDHDTVSGLPEAFAAARGQEIEIIAGIEFSTEYKGRDIHIIGLDFDYEDPFFLEQLTHFRAARKTRNEKMIARMRADGIDISERQIQEAYGDPVITRAHFARYLMEHGYVAEMADAYREYVGEDGRYYVPREKVTPVQAVQLIARTGGIPVLAHPMQYGLLEDGLDVLLGLLKEAGLIGVEVFYSKHTRPDERLVSNLAKKNGLLPSGGSDFHGSNKPLIDLGCGRGNLNIPYSVLEDLRDRRDGQ